MMLNLQRLLVIQTSGLKSTVELSPSCSSIELTRTIRFLLHRFPSQLVEWENVRESGCPCKMTSLSLSKFSPSNHFRFLVSVEAPSFYID